MKRVKKEYYFIVILLICFILLTSFVVLGKLDTFDKNAFDTIIKLKNVPLTYVLKVITYMASTFAIIALIIVIGLVFYRRKALSSFKYIIINVASGVLLMEGFKHVIKRSRPVWKWIKQSGFSYPSGHTISALLLYGTLMLLIYKKVQGKYKTPLLLIFTAMIVLTAISRIYFGAHYVTDVVASILLGSIILIVSNMLMNKEFNSDKNKTK